MLIRKATFQDIKTIHHLAHQTWWPTYSNVIPSEQIEFMLQEIYSTEALKQQMQEGNTFLIAEREARPIAFASFSLMDPAQKVYKLHKLYVHPSEQGKGSGKKMIDEVAALSKSLGGEILELNVNRNNPAFSFYQKLGFEIYQIVDIPYHQFILNDFIMRKAL
ncbi:MAG TPA: GNAT family N-acetyltransferase [Daejeonella sp.]|nr:GNAT family N-acetyltransferase [Daejeonella sp.]